MNVTIPYCRYNAFGHPITRTAKVTISDNCPTCGQKRGTPYSYLYTDNQGATVTVNFWRNQCGHDDHYQTVLKEAIANGNYIPDAILTRH